MTKIGERAILVLTDGRTFEGRAFGQLSESDAPVWGEVVFNTSLFGYQEILTDPSYAGQILCFTAPHIGNVGCNSLDEESRQVHPPGVVIRDLTKITSNYRAQSSLDEYLSKHGRMGIEGIDTRALVRHLRDNGSQLGALAVGGKSSAAKLVEKLRNDPQCQEFSKINFVKEVSCREPYGWSELPWDHKLNCYPKLGEDDLKGRPHIVAIDCGIKYNILRLLTANGFKVTVVPWNYSPDQIRELKPDGIFISNGPGDPAQLGEIVQCTKSLLGQFPMFGICLGHQIIGQAVGGKTFKLKFGHRGGNHPVRYESNKVIEISVQNHGYAVSMEGLPKEAHLSHVNLNDGTVEGLDLPSLRAFSVQYHPEASPGPHDAQYLFKRFYDLVVNA